MEIKNLKDAELNEKVKILAFQERKLTQTILWHIAEVDRRKLFLRKAYPSLFEYLTQEIGYSAGSAQRRIDAARLLQRVPEISKHIETGAIHLSQISKLQKICRQIKKVSGKSVEISVQKGILQKIVNQSAEQTELILAQEFKMEIKTQEKKQIQQDESVRIEMTFSKEEMELMKKAQNLLSNKTGGTLKDTLIEMAQRVVNSHKPKIQNQKPSAIVSSNNNPTFTVASTSPLASDNTVNDQATAPTNFITAAVEVKNVTPKLRKEILSRDQFCQFKDPKTGKVCGSQKFLEIDHIQPRFADGENRAKNLRVLCKSHNLFRYQAGL